jgi:hypothetical protein
MLSPSDDGRPLLELSAMQDFYCDGTERIEILGDNVRVVYFVWKQIEGVWRRVGADFSRICPVRSIAMPAMELSGIAVIERMRPTLVLRQ